MYHFLNAPSLAEFWVVVTIVQPFPSGWGWAFTQFVNSRTPWEASTHLGYAWQETLTNIWNAEHSGKPKHINNSVVNGICTLQTIFWGPTRIGQKRFCIVL